MAVQEAWKHFTNTGCRSMSAAAARRHELDPRSRARLIPNIMLIDWRAASPLSLVGSALWNAMAST